MQLLDTAWYTLRSWNRVRGRLNLGSRRRGWKYHHVRGVGGSTLHFTGEAHRLHPQAMQMRARFGVGADWPIDFAELEPYYEIAERLIGVAGPAPGHSLRQRRSAFPLPAHAPGYASRLLMDSAASTELRWEANALAVLSRPYDGRPACNFCANCNRGCPRMDKGSADVTFMRHAAASGRCTVVTGAAVQRIEVGADRRVQRVIYARDGQEHSVDTRVLVLACGAVETPRLLLNATSAQAPDGLANESGQVGRHFMETLFWSWVGLHPTDLGSYRGLPADLILWTHNAPDTIPGVVGGCRFSTATTELGFGGPVAYARRAVPGWGLAHKQAMRYAMGHLLAVSSIGESLPNAQTYIDRDPLAREAFGQPLARIHSALGEGELRRLSFMASTCRTVMRAAGIGELVEENSSYDYFSTTHAFGSCRMAGPTCSSPMPASSRAAWVANRLR